MALTLPYTTNLKLLLDATAITASDGYTLTTWNDTSGNGNHAAPYTGSAGGVFKTGIFGTQPCVRFAASDSGMAGLISGITGNMTVLMAGSFAGPLASYGGILSLYDSAYTADTNNTHSLAYRYYGGSSYVVATANNSSYGYIPAAVLTLPNVLGLSNTYNTYGFPSFWGGPTPFNSSYAASPVVATPSNYLIGQVYTASAATTNQAGKADFLAIAVYSEALSTTNMRQVITYLSQQIGIYATYVGGTKLNTGIRGMR